MIGYKSILDKNMCMYPPPPPTIPSVDLCATDKKVMDYKLIMTKYYEVIISITVTTTVLQTTQLLDGVLKEE